MTSQVIPTETVEAAAKEIYRVAADLAYESDTWDDLSENQRQVWVDDAKRILEAAAPHMLAGAKAEALIEAAEVAERGEGGGHDSGECDDWGVWLRSRANTYRPTP